MLRALQKCDLKNLDYIFMCAAVSDYKPSQDIVYNNKLLHKLDSNKPIKLNK